MNLLSFHNLAQMLARHGFEVETFRVLPGPHGLVLSVRGEDASGQQFLASQLVSIEQLADARLDLGEVLWPELCDQILEPPPQD